jgi:hypothetical protein
VNISEIPAIFIPHIIRGGVLFGPEKSSPLCKQKKNIKKGWHKGVAMKGISTGRKNGLSIFGQMLHNHTLRTKNGTRELAMKGVRFRFGYDRLSRECSQSERDGCAQIRTTISMPLPVCNPIVGKGRQ